MSSCRWTKTVERWFDEGMTPDRTAARHVAECPHCAQTLALLKQMREGAQTAARREAVSNSQFPAFMEGIREGIETEQAPAWHFNRLWTLSSLAAAALIASASLFTVFTGERGEVEGSVVESYSTDLENADVSSYSTENGTTTVWVTTAEEDLW
ncbi:MAG: hypothetical protein ACLFV4_04330 [Candidatus Hydrogenedentota bacterium]